MSMSTKLHNFWSSVSDPRYNSTTAGSVYPPGHSKAPNSKTSSSSSSSNNNISRFDRSSRRCQSSLNIQHSHAFPTGAEPRRIQIPRKLSTPHQHGNIHVPCKVCQENNNFNKNLQQHPQQQRPPPVERSASSAHEFLASSSSAAANNNNDFRYSMTRRNSTSSTFAAASATPGSRSALVPAMNYANQMQHHHPVSAMVYVEQNGGGSPNGTVAKFIVPQGSDAKSLDRNHLLPIESLLEERQSSCPNPDVTPPSPYESVKMRMHKPPAEARPKSVEFSQRKAWLRAYRDLELQQATESKTSSTSATASTEAGKRRSKGRSKSILHLHRLDSQPVVDDAVDTMSNHSDDSGSSLKGPTLLQRFSKTFSMRFGNGGGSNANIANASQHGKKKVVKNKYPIGSSPDLYHRNDEETNKETGWRWRQSSNPLRNEKCKSGDSGIGLPAEELLRKRPSRRVVRKTLSEDLGEVILQANRQSVYSVIEEPATGRKLSFIEIPDGAWEDLHNGSSDGSRGFHSNSSGGSPDLCKSLEDLEADEVPTSQRPATAGSSSRLEDDGFVSDDEAQQVTRPPPYVRPRRRANSSAEGFANRKPSAPTVHRWSAEVGGANGRRRRSGEILDLLAMMDTPGHWSNDGGIRGRVVADIVKTEYNYVKTLNDIVQGFLIPCRKEKALFSLQNIENIFANIEEIFRLHARFLEALVSCVDKENFAQSMIGHIFTLWTDEFDPYCDYSCSNKISTLAIKNLMAKNSKYNDFFEACRRLQYMDKLPLHGFLLRPIQRICQYQLQLQELLKKTDPSHKDYESTKEALDSMRKVAEKVNNAQKQFDTFVDMMDLQLSMDLFQGPNLMDKNVAILHRGDLAKAHQGKKHKDVHVVLLNSELVFCKKLHRDMTKPHSLSFLGRIDLSQKLIHDIESGRDDSFFGTVHNSWRIYSKEKSCWVLFTAMISAEKSQWLQAIGHVTNERYFGTFSAATLSQMRERVRELLSERCKSVALGTSSSTSSSSGGSNGTSDAALYKHNTLPKSKKSKAKNNSSTSETTSSSEAKTTDSSEAMLIEVGKLKRSSCNLEGSKSQNNVNFSGSNSSSVDGGSNRVWNTPNYSTPGSYQQLRFNPDRILGSGNSNRLSVFYV